MERDLARAQLLGLRRRFYEPRKEGTIVDERRPESRVPRNVLGNGGTGLAVQMGSTISSVR